MDSDGYRDRATDSSNRSKVTRNREVRRIERRNRRQSES